MLSSFPRPWSAVCLGFALLAGCAEPVPSGDVSFHAPQAAQALDTAVPPAWWWLPLVTDERGTPGVELGAAWEKQEQPSVAFDGTNFLVVWTDYRRRGYLQPDIYGARVTPEGRVLDPAGIPLCIRDGAQQLPRVAFDGKVFLVVWTDELDYGTGGIAGTRVTPGGEVLDPDGVRLSPKGIGALEASVAPGPGHFLVVWTERDMSRVPEWEWNIGGARVTSEARVLDPGGLRISSAAADQRWPVVSFDGRNHLVAWNDARNGPAHANRGLDIFGARVAPDGRVLNAQDLPLVTGPKGEGFPVLGFDGENHLLVWTHDLSDDPERRWGLFDVHGARVSPAGEVLDTPPLRISTAPGRQGVQSLSFDGQHHLVLWRDDRSNPDNAYVNQLYATRVDRAGVVLAPDGLPLTTHLTSKAAPTAAFGAGRHLVVWGESDGVGGSDIYGTRVSPSGAVLDPTRREQRSWGYMAEVPGLHISTAATRQVSPAVASDGTGFLMTWVETRYGVPCPLYGLRLGAWGSPLDSEPVLLSESAVCDEPPAVSFHDSHYLVAWADLRSNRTPDVYAARLSPRDGLLAPGAFPVADGDTCQHAPALSADGEGHLLVWEELPWQRDDGCSEYPFWSGTVQGARVDAAGTVTRLSTPLKAGPSGQQRPRLSFDGTNHLLVWETGNRELKLDLWGARVSPSGELLDTGGFALAATPRSESHAELAFDGTHHLLVWYQGGFAEPDHDILGARIRKDGTVLDTEPLAIARTPVFEETPDVAFDGRRFAVVWSQDTGKGMDLRGTWVTPEGEVLPPSARPFGGEASERRAPVLAAAGARVLLAYEHVQSRPPLGARRVGARVLLPARVSVDTPAPQVGQPVSFSLVEGALEEALSWHWDFGDGSLTRASLTATHVYSAPGAYAVLLRGQDASGEGVTLTWPLEVSPLPMQQPPPVEPPGPPMTVVPGTRASGCATAGAGGGLCALAWLWLLARGRGRRHGVPRA